MYTDCSGWSRVSCGCGWCQRTRSNSIIIIPQPLPVATTSLVLYFALYNNIFFPKYHSTSRLTSLAQHDNSLNASVALRSITRRSHRSCPCFIRRQSRHVSDLCSSLYKTRLWRRRTSLLLLDIASDTLDVCWRVQVQLHALAYRSSTWTGDQDPPVLREMAVLAVHGHARTCFRVILNIQPALSCKRVLGD